MYLDTLINRLCETADQALDSSDRQDHNGDEFLRGMLSAYQGIADQVWGSSTEYEEKDLERLRYAGEKASKAYTYLRSGAPALQRALIEPTDEAVKKRIAEIWQRKTRANSPTCTVRILDGGNGVLEHLRVPWGTHGPALKMLIWNSRNFGDVKHVLSAIGLTGRTWKYEDGETTVRIDEIAGEEITLDRPSARPPATPAPTA